MSDNTNVAAGDTVSPAKEWTYEGLEYQLALALNRSNNLITGKILTLIETLGLAEPREKALKDVAKQMILGSLRMVGRDFDWFVNNVKHNGIKATPDANIPPISLVEFTHWDSPQSK